MVARGAVAALALLMPGVAGAQALSCAVPAVVDAPRPDLPSDSQPRRVLPIASYTLAITWSPEYCRARKASARDAFQCAGTRPKFGFTLHGLWPDGAGREWPQYCRATAVLPKPVVRANLCATPSAQLLQHEWAKHGTCMTDRPADYFAQSRRLYDTLRYPDMNALSRRTLDAGGFARAFAAVNPGMRADMMRVTATRNGWLDEVWICLSRTYRPVACPAHQGGLPAGAPLRIWRGGGR
ncbi:ribonuclease T2 family protein [Sphingomonas montana]|uniref:ribonuclease T2 family protein n=1 Tax=Sphingomonas montana TaxID=1843236 RepID=UPI0009701B3E|nr:ribonuclease T [Sphingomonas montana]